MSSSAIDASSPTSGRRLSFRALPVLALAGLVALFAGLLYLNVLNNPFFYDDYRLIVENGSILDLTDLPGIVYRDVTRPLVNLSYAVDAAVWGQSPFGFHLTSVLLHMCNVGLVVYVAWLLADDRRRQQGELLPATAARRVIAAATGLLFAAHPLMTQAVGYISGRSEVLYASFFLLAFLAARRWMLAGGARWWLAAVGLWGAALLAKETAAMFGFVVVCYDHLVLDGDAAEKRRRLWRLHLPMMSLMLLAGVVRVFLLLMVEYPGDPPGDWRFALVSVEVVWRYLVLLAIPRGQSVFHDVPTLAGGQPGLASVVALVGLAGLLAAVWRLRRVHSVIGFGFSWFVLLLVPSGLLFALGRGEPMAEHRVYGASIGVFLVAGSAFGMLVQRFDRRNAMLRTLFYVLSAFFVIQLGGRTIIRNALWGDPVALSREAVGLAPDHWMPRLLLGEALRTSGRCAAAVTEYRTAIRFQPSERFGYTKLAACLLETGQFDEAATVLEQLDAVHPGEAQAPTGLALLALVQGRTNEARIQVLKALELSPSDPSATLLLAFLDGSLDPTKASALCADFERLSGNRILPERCLEEKSRSRGSL